MAQSGRSREQRQENRRGRESPQSQPDSVTGAAAEMLALQRTAGNAAVQRMVRAGLAGGVLARKRPGEFDLEEKTSPSKWTPSKVREGKSALGPVIGGARAAANAMTDAKYAPPASIGDEAGTLKGASSSKAAPAPSGMAWWDDESVSKLWHR